MINILTPSVVMRRESLKFEREHNYKDNYLKPNLMHIAHKTQDNSS